MTGAGHTAGELLPCPFCGAKPHQGLGKVQHCSLHGEPFQRFHIKCPKLHAEISAPNRERAVEAWNRRHCGPRAVEAAEGDLLGKALETLKPFAQIGKRKANLYIRPDDPIILAAIRVLSQAQAREVTR